MSAAVNGTRAVRPRRRGRWTARERELLQRWFGLRELNWIARELDRSPVGVRRKARELFRHSRRGPWSAAEVETLKLCLGVSSPDDIALRLGRSPAEIEGKVRELGKAQRRGRWSPHEIARLKRLYGRRSDADLAMILGRNVESVRRQAQRLHLAKDKAFLRRINGSGSSTMPRWKKAEVQILREMYPRCSNLEIAQRLDRSVKSVISKAHHIGLRKNTRRLREMGRQNVARRYHAHS